MDESTAAPATKLPPEDTYSNICVACSKSFLAIGKRHAACPECLAKSKLPLPLSDVIEYYDEIITSIGDYELHRAGVEADFVMRVGDYWILKFGATRAAGLPQRVAELEKNEVILRSEWARECHDADRLLVSLGMVAEQFRTEGGSLNVPKIHNWLIDRQEGLNQRALELEAQLLIARREERERIALVFDSMQHTGNMHMAANIVRALMEAV